MKEISASAFKLILVSTWRTLADHMASAEREPITGVWERSLSGVQGQSPWSGGKGGEVLLKLKAF